MIVAANLKTNLTRKETREYVNAVENFALTNSLTQDIFVFPATSSLDTFETKVTVGAQNAYAVQNGAFTGEIGLDHLDEFGIKTILIGHSERRHILGETQELIAQKFNYFKELGFTIIYCVGEPLEKREAGTERMMEYIDAQYEGIDTNYEKLIIAYEPVWAIGTGLTPTNEDIVAIHTELKKKSLSPLLYGGSVKVNNAQEIMALENVDGVLVGSAALKVEDFCQMVTFAEELDKLV
ncbi:triose-phosphate isomerase [Sulfurimonas sp.]|uniref:triose-phosphate isomerase n=1 Tax=Sulfurimonas sp. TaxID=2022749 RepID=UPI003D0C35C3